MTDSQPLIHPPIMNLICRTVSQHKNVYVCDIVSERRQRDYTEARQIVCYVAAKFTGLSLPAIGRAIRRDHTTVRHSIRTIEEKLADGRIDIAPIERDLKQHLEQNRHAQGAVGLARKSLDDLLKNLSDRIVAEAQMDPMKTLRKLLDAFDQRSGPSQGPSR